MNYSTPCYIFDTVELKNRVQYLRSRLPEHLKLCYAVKANPFLVKELEPLVDRFELCSEGEYRICEAAGIDERKHVISGVHKERAFLEELIRKMPGTGHYTVESESQFVQLRDLAGRQGRQITVLLRLTSGNQFGMDQEVIEEIIRDADVYPQLEIRGIQFFSGTQKTSLKRTEKELEKVMKLLQVLEEKYGYRAQEIEYGPGFPVSYFEGEAFEEEEYLEGFAGMMRRLPFRGEITLELGRSIAASCGSYYTRVVDQKINRGEGYAIVDGGIHQLVYYGQTMAMKQPKWRLLKTEEGKRESGRQTWNICGSLCTINDILVKQMPAEGLAVGDVLEFRNAGAYCMTEGISLFLSRDLPKIFLRKKDGQLQCVRGRIETAAFNQPALRE